MADVVILAENTPKVAVSKENSSRSVISDQRGLLAEMGKGAGDQEFYTSSTVPHLSIETIDPTFPRTETTLA
jgi:hypothetical protein